MFLEPEQREKVIRYGPPAAGILAALGLIWLCQLIPTGKPISGSRPEPYYVVALFSVLGSFFYWKYGSNKKLHHRWIIPLGSLLFALMLTLGNYPSWYIERTSPGLPLWHPWIFAAWMLVGFTTGTMAFCAMARILDLLTKKARGHYYVPPVWVYIVSFAALASIMLFIFFTALYPGLWLSDSISQIKQSYENVYSNHHPFAHTMLIKALFTMGYVLTGNPNGAMAAYSIVSILIMSAICAYAVMTLYELSRTYWIPICALAFFAFMYYNWFYAVSVLKDTYFSMSCLGFLTAMLRMLYPVGRRLVNAWWLGFFTLGVCVFRSNGLIAMLALALLLWLILRRQQKRMKSIILGTAIAGYIITGPLYSAFGVSPVAFGESLSIPIQQISRVIWNRRLITEEEAEKLDKILPLEDYSHNYTYWLSDPVKFLITTEETDPYLKANIGTYAGVYLDLLFRYPMDYLTAWVGQTMGYWNGAYDYWRVLETKKPNQFGMYNTIPNPQMRSAVYNYASWIQTYMPWLVGIGFQTWIVFALWIYMMCENKRCWPIALFLLLTTGTLVIATPVYSEFRYAYYMFLCMPVVMASVLLDRKSREKIPPKKPGKFQPQFQEFRRRFRSLFGFQKENAV